MSLHRCWTACLVAAACLLAASGVWAADPASVMPAQVDWYVTLDLDAAQQVSDQVLPHLSHDYWAKSDEPGGMGLAALAAVSPVIHAQLAAVRSVAGPAVGVGVYELADLHGAYVSHLLEMPARTPAPKGAATTAKRPRPFDLARTLLPHLDLVIAAEIRDPAQAKPLLDALAARHKRSKRLPRLAVHFTDEWVVLATKPQRLEQAKAVIAGKQPALVSRPAYQEIAADLAPGAAAFVYADIARWGPAVADHARKAMEKAWAEAEKRKQSDKPAEGEPPTPQQGKGPGAVAAVMKQYMALYWKIVGDYYAALRGAGASFHLDRSGVERHELWLVDPEKAAQVPVLGRVAEPVPMTGACLGALPAGSLAVIAGGGVGKQASTLLEGAVEFDPSLGMFIGLGKGMVGGFLGLDVDKDLLPAMERDAAAALLALDMASPMPAQVALVLQGRDEGAASALGAKLDALATQRFKTKLERGAIGSVAFRQFALPNAPFGVCYAQLGDLLVVTTGQQALKACLDAHADRRLSLAAAPEVERLISAAGSTSLLYFVRAGPIVSQAALAMPPRIKRLLGGGIGLDWLGLAAGGDAERQALVTEMRGDMVILAETASQVAALVARGGLLRQAKPKPRPPVPKPAEDKP